MISIEQIKTLRDKTGISIAQCKKALEATGGDMDKAMVALREAGMAMVEKKSGRALGAGVIGVYLHTDNALCSLVELACETDFVAKNPDFKTLADNLAMHVSAFAPSNTEELFGQPFVKDQSLTVEEVVRGATQKFGERVELSRFERFAVGE